MLQIALAHWGTSLGLEKREREDRMKDRPIVLRKRRERLKSVANWKLFYYKFGQNHVLPSLIWNHKVNRRLACESQKKGEMLISRFGFADERRVTRMFRKRIAYVHGRPRGVDGNVNIVESRRIRNTVFVFARRNMRRRLLFAIGVGKQFRIVDHQRAVSVLEIFFGLESQALL